jgi:16S rRNA pseudouridine516 synthase
MKLEQILFSQGFGTRRHCRALILSGAVSVGGEPCEDPGADWPVSATASADGAEPLSFSVEGTAWQYHARAYLMLHKPAGYECSQKPRHHPSVIALLPEPLRARGVQPVGRLDEDTTGLLLLSDDGQFIHRMTSPRHEVPKRYDVTTAAPVTDEQMARLLAGVVLDDSPEPVAALACERLAHDSIWLTLTSGKYHQVKRMLAAVRNHVVRLHRSRMGLLELPADLAEGQWQWLSPADLGQLVKLS